MTPPSRRARLAVLVAVVTVAVATAGAVTVLRPEAAGPARLRHQVKGAGGDDPTLTQAGSIAASGATAAGAAASGTSAAGAAVAGASAAATGSAGAVTTTTTTTAVTGQPGKAPAAGQVPTGPAPAGNGAPSTPAKASPVPGWRLLPTAPIGGRLGHAAVWTGREMVIWGGMPDLDSDPVTDGAAFDPAAGTWRKLPAAPLSPRFDATALWTGREMLVFGGTSTDGDILADGAAWDPSANRWRPLPASPLGPRDGAVVAWAGDRMVVWGGATVPPPGAPDTPTSGDTPEPPGLSEMRADGSAYVPATDSWVPVPAAPIAARSGAESVWSGTRLLISGGYHEGDDDDRTDGAALDPVSGAWSPIAARPAPGSCGGDTPCDGVWTGAAALFPASGLAYDPAGDRWSAVAPYPSADSSVLADPAVWTGTRLLAWGAPSDPSADDAGADPADAGATADAGTATASDTGTATDAATATDTGTVADNGAGTADDSSDGPPPRPVGGSYDPAADRWQPVPAGPLSGRVLHSAVWTGQEMLVWGGTAGDAGLADGASYRP